MNVPPPPKVSVCVDTYNYADFLPAALESVLSQTLADFELIVGDDCSTDGSFAIAQGYEEQDGRVRVFQNPSNLGMVRNRNACLSRARGAYVKFVHADDFLCAPNALARLVAVLDDNPAAVLAASAMRFVDANGAPLGKVAPPAPFRCDRLLAGTNVIARCLREQKNLIGGPSAVLFRRDRAARGFDEHYFHAADLEMWFHLLEQGCFGYVPDLLVAYRWHGRQQTEKDRASLSQADDQRALLRTYLDRPYIRLRPWRKRFLVHEAARQTVRRGRKLGRRAEAAAAVREYGTRGYYQDWPWCFLYRKLGRPLGLWESRLPPHAEKFGPRPATPDRPIGINVAGFFQGEYGIGASSRALCRAVEETGVPHTFLNVRSRDHRNQDASVERFSSGNPYRVNLMTFSFDYARRFYRDWKPAFFAGRRNIALWYWELETFPARWHGTFDYYDEIWTPTEFCRRALAAVSPIPVYQITYPLYAADGDPPAPDRAGFGLGETACVFLFTFDYCSTVARKNPLAVVQAFGRAFAPDENAVLVLKSINAWFDPAGCERLRQAADGLKVVFLDEHLPGARMNALFASADCYVSLHRSEGLGLGMAQAMAQGKPVIATNYSGNLEYMTAQNSLLVDYKPVELAEDYGPYPKGAFWAEPSVAQAAEKMRWVHDHPNEAARLGAHARANVRRALDPHRTRDQILQRVREA